MRVNEDSPCGKSTSTFYSWGIARENDLALRITLHGQTRPL